MKAEGLEFREALELLAERAGIHAAAAAAASRAVSRRSTRRATSARCYRVMAWAEEQFHRCLLDAPEARAGRAYLAERGITPESDPPVSSRLRAESLGLAARAGPRQRVVAGACSSASACLRRKELGGGHYDWFRGRVMFSIRDARSRPIAFGGRVLPQLADDRSAKYINSPETPLFSKSRELYGLDVAREQSSRRAAARS